MDLDYVEKLIGVVVRSPIAELEIERDGMRVRICKHAAAPALGAGAPQPAPVVSVDAAAVSTSPVPAQHVIRAPLSGVFNVVEADRAGRIVEIPVDNAAAVQSGDVLFVLEEAEQG
jgi:acetyl-CoA carboxylase biotin carboxyl carrier protein